MTKHIISALAAACSLAMLMTATPGSARQKPAKQKYTVAAYIWPSCHNDKMGQEVLWPEGHGEWEIIKKGTPRFEGHYQPKVPLWGYEHDDDPKVMERWIDTATEHGVNTFIFDWYWFNNGPFLEGCINDGFLKAANNRKMHFYIMWADHDVARNYWNVHRYKDDTSRLWAGAIDWDNWRIVVERIIRQYFKQPNYLKIDGKPVFAVFDTGNLIKTFGSPEEARKGIAYLDEKCREAGFSGVHLQMMTFLPTSDDFIGKARQLGAATITEYNWGFRSNEDYLSWGKESMDFIDQWDAKCDIPFLPNATIGWDDTPRFPAKGKKDLVHYNRSPQAFACYLQRAKEYLDRHPQQPQIITINAWNEWVEGSYLLPDAEFGFGYLNAVKDVIVDGKYDKHTAR